MRGTSSRRFPLPVVPGRLVPAALAVLAGLLYLYFGLRWHASNVFWIIGAMLSGVLGPLGWTSVGRMIPEYNTTIATLRQMFRTVEECQGRFLNERNRSNTILQSLPGALLSVSDDLRISIANRQADALFGVEAGRLIGIDLFGLLDLNERDRELLRDEIG